MGPHGRHINNLQMWRHRDQTHWAGSTSFRHLISHSSQRTLLKAWSKNASLLCRTPCRQISLPWVTGGHPDAAVQAVLMKLMGLLHPHDHCWSEAGCKHRTLIGQSQLQWNIVILSSDFISTLEAEFPPALWGSGFHFHHGGRKIARWYPQPCPQSWQLLRKIFLVTWFPFTGIKLRRLRFLLTCKP